ncbi:hypothetical protein ES332_A10G234300v1 [Gossypium tomentosum]|uniref:Uncharacterized protein n=1 Tax=Gossypium tomentosum TaxID=34277 RepID=A0A5D2NVC7_GOSTO|nr:hypothetical protein ES332_A10G234300v1 [Gossypium tomentosum]
MEVMKSLILPHSAKTILSSSMATLAMASYSAHCISNASNSIFISLELLNIYFRSANIFSLSFCASSTCTWRAASFFFSTCFTSDSTSLYLITLRSNLCVIVNLIDFFSVRQFMSCIAFAARSASSFRLSSMANNSFFCSIVKVVGEQSKLASILNACLSEENSREP